MPWRPKTKSPDPHGSKNDSSVVWAQNITPYHTEGINVNHPHIPFVMPPQPADERQTELFRKLRFWMFWCWIFASSTASFITATVIKAYVNHPKHTGAAEAHGK